MFFGTKYPIFGKFLFLRNLCYGPTFMSPTYGEAATGWPLLIECTNLCLQDEDQARNQI
jgi:hypothetical protein